MRKSLEKTITGPYRDIAKEQIRHMDKIMHGKDEDITPEEVKELRTVLNWHLNRTAKDRTGKGKHSKLVKQQKEIFKLQRKKQEIVKWLEEERKRLNDPDYQPEKEPESRDVFYDNEQFWLIGDNSETSPLTLGEIITDYEFGITYFLDQSVPKAVQKKYALEKTKRELHNLLEEQIVLDELSLGNGKVGAPFTEKRKVLTGKIEYACQQGFLAEVMVSNFLEKLSIDCDVDFKLIKTDVYEDVFHKVDFIIKRKSHNRGVKVEETDNNETESVGAKNFGIQLTLKSHAPGKRRQIRQTKEKMGTEMELDDIILVSIPIGGLAYIYSKWIDANRPSGGPDKLWDEETKHFIIERVFYNLLTPEEIADLQTRV